MVSGRRAEGRRDPGMAKLESAPTFRIRASSMGGCCYLAEVVTL